MIGTFGSSIVFEVSEKSVFAFKKLTQEIKGRWASHDHLGGKPKKEFLGANAREAALEIYLSANLGVRPRTVLKSLENMAEKGEVEYLIIGDTPISKNRFLLASVSEAWDKVYNDGSLVKATVSITLEEYPE
jgi:phage protein U